MTDDIDGVDYILPEPGRIVIRARILSEFGESTNIGTSLSENVKANVDEMIMRAAKNALVEHFYNMEQKGHDVRFEDFMSIDPDTGKKELDYNEMLKLFNFNFTIIEHFFKYIDKKKFFEFKDRWGNKRVGKRNLKTGKFMANYTFEDIDIEEVNEVAWEEVEVTTVDDMF